MKKMVLKTLEVFPKDIVDYVTTHVWFVSSFEDGWAFTLRGDELKSDEHLVFLSDELLKEDENQIMWTIAHELGHVILGHKNSIAKRQAPLIGKVQNKSEIKKQERDADQFAKQHLNSL